MSSVKPTESESSRQSRTSRSQEELTQGLGLDALAESDSSSREIDGNWQEVADELNKRVDNLSSQASALTGVAVANSLAAQSTFFGYASQAFQPAGGLPMRAETGPIVRAFWWGFHIEIGHNDLETVLNAADTVNALVGLIGGNIPSPAAPWIKLLAPFVASVHQGLRALDRGRGIYISMSWFAPGIFIPTSV
jgi:hypothetical protein